MYVTFLSVTGTTKLWSVFKILCHFQWLIHFSSEINFRKAKAFVKNIDSSIFLHIMTRTMIQTKCGDLHEVEVLKVMKTPKGFECRNRPGRTANYRRRRNQLMYMVHEVNSWDESRLKDTPMIHTNDTNKPNQIKKKLEITPFHLISIQWYELMTDSDWLNNWNDLI